MVHFHLEESVVTNTAFSIPNVWSLIDQEQLIRKSTNLNLLFPIGVNNFEVLHSLQVTVKRTCESWLHVLKEGDYDLLNLSHIGLDCAWILLSKRNNIIFRLYFVVLVI